MIHHRRSIRLQNYDYTQAGAYFVTLCAHARECLFGEVVDGEMRLNEYGRIAAEEWERSTEIRREIEMDAWIVMPNHLHGIVVIVDDDLVGAHGRAPLQDHIPLQPNQPHSLHRKPRSLGSFIAGFKSIVTKRVNELRHTPGFAVWQRNYYEHVIRNEADLTRVRNYITANPARWADDENHPQRISQNRSP